MENSIAILGATSHIAKGIIFNLFSKGTYNLALYARNTSKLFDFTKSIGYHHTIYDLSEFGREKHDVVINCIGVGDPANVKALGSKIFTITEQFDNMVVQYLLEKPECLYINFSSGVAYGSDFTKPVQEETAAQYPINYIGQQSYYGLAKLYSEVKHRSMRHLKIVDLRVFGYYSRFIDLTAKFFLTEIITCLKNGIEFVTGPDDIIRDYVSPEDLTSIVTNCIESKYINDVFDVYSCRPISKFEILEFYKQYYGLKYKVQEQEIESPITGSKSKYYSLNKRAEAVIGYIPQYSSLECLICETELMEIKSV